MSRVPRVLVLFALAAAACCLIRLDGVYGDFSGDMDWRWAPTAEERFLAETNDRNSEKSTAAEQAKLVVPGSNAP